MVSIAFSYPVSFTTFMHEGYCEKYKIWTAGLVKHVHARVINRVNKKL